MRSGRAFSIAVMAVVAILSLRSSEPAIAQSRRDVTVRMEAVEALIAEIVPAAKPHGQVRPPVRIAFVDEESTWVPSPPPPPEDFQTEGVLQCVPYARFMSGIGIRGDAWTWWDKAAGIYARGNHPEPGAVLSFPGIERMPLGHVAVVTQVLNNRKILIDHANWPNAVVQHGAISRDIQVVDVSSANDWSEVRVQFGEGGPLGSVYPSNGFIYGWTEAGVRIAQPRFSLDYALWSPEAPSWRTFNSISYYWALPPVERKKAYAAAGMVPPPGTPARGRPVLVLGPVGRGFTGSAFASPLGVNRLDVGPDVRMLGRTETGQLRYVIQ